MISDILKNKAHTLIEIARAQDMVVKYSDWCNTDEAEEYALSDNEVEQYKNKN